MTVRSTFVPGQEIPRLSIERITVFVPGETWTYSHHAHIGVFNGSLYAMWSNGFKNEDDTDQRVLLSQTEDFSSWPKAEILAVPEPGRILTAGGFHVWGNTLVAYYCGLDTDLTKAEMYARTTTDSGNWKDAISLGIPTCANHSPRPTASGRLLTAAQLQYPYTDSPDGLSEWNLAGTECPEGEALCESAFFQSDDGIIHMLLRNFGKGEAGKGYQGKLWITESVDNAESWSPPVEADFPDNNQKFHFGRLPDGRFYYVGTPDPKSVRRGFHSRGRLVLSLSRDGAAFDEHHLIADEPYVLRVPGRHKNGQYGYPSTLIDGGFLYVIVSRMKESIEVLRVPLEAV